MDRPRRAWGGRSRGRNGPCPPHPHNPPPPPPPVADRDKDGIPDDDDECPNDPEDKDGFEDDDGCPDPDNEKDGIVDLPEKCPTRPGGPPAGCPKKTSLVVVTEKKIELKQTVFFDTNRATIKPVSFALLDQVA